MKTLPSLVKTTPFEVRINTADPICFSIFCKHWLNDGCDTKSLAAAFEILFSSSITEI